MISDEEKPVSWYFIFFASFFLDFFIFIRSIVAFLRKFFFFFFFLGLWRWNSEKQSLNSDTEADAGKDANDRRDCEHKTRHDSAEVAAANAVDDQE